MTTENQGMDTTQDSTSPVESNPAASETTQAPEAQSADGASPDVPGQQTPPPYTVNATYKVKNLEKKFPDWVLPVVKDARTEAELREIFQKADGVDFVKQDRQALKEKVSTYEQKYQSHYAPMEQAVQKLTHFRDKKDFDSMFAVAGVQPQEVLQWALRFAQSSPEQRASDERRREAELQAMNYQSQNEQMQQAYAQQAADYRARELDMTLTRPDVSDAVQDFEAMNGQGSFRQEVIRRGQFYAYQGQDISAEQAVMEVLKLAGRAPQAQATQAQPQQMPMTHSQGQQQMQMQQPQGVQQTSVVQRPKPVIPNIQGRGTSPVKRVVSSVDDLRRLSKEMNSSEG